MVRACLIAAMLVLLAPLTATARPVDDASAAFDPEFDGKISYVGNYTGQISVLREGAGRQRYQPCPYRDRRCLTQTVGGGLKVWLKLRGDHIIGKYESSGDLAGWGGLGSGELRGRRTETGCQLFQTDGTVWQGVCDTNGFSGEIISVAGAAKQSRVAFTTLGMQMLDQGALERVKAEAAAREARIDWLGRLINSDAPVERRVVAAIELDSYGWERDAIRRGGISAPTGKTHKRKPYQLFSTVSLVSGREVSVAVAIERGEIQCLDYGIAGGCRPIRAPIPIAIPAQQFDDPWFDGFEETGTN